MEDDECKDAQYVTVVSGFDKGSDMYVYTLPSWFIDQNSLGKEMITIKTEKELYQEIESRARFAYLKFRFNRQSKET